MRHWYQTNLETLRSLSKLCFWLILLPGLAYIWWNPSLGYTDDDARMILEARALWTDGTLSPSWPSHAGMLIALAPIAHDLILCHLFVWTCFFGLVWVVWLWSESEIATLLVATAPWLLFWASDVMTELPFTLLVVGALWQSEEKNYWVALCLAAGACLFRSIGVVLIAAIFVNLVDWKRPWMLPISGFVLLGAAAWAKLTHGTVPGMSVGPYREGGFAWADYPGRILENIETYVTYGVPFAVIPHESFTLFGIAIALLAVGGLAWFKDWTILTFLGLYMGVLLLWPEDLSGTRYVAPLLPLLILGLDNTRDFDDPDWRKVSGVIMAGLLMVSVGVTGARAVNGGHVPHGVNGYFALAERVRDVGMPAETLVVCRKVSAWRVLAGTEAVSYPFEADPEKLRAWMKEVGADYVVLDQLEYSQTLEYLAPAIGEILPTGELVIGEGFKVAGHSIGKGEKAPTLFLKVEL